MDPIPGHSDQTNGVSRKKPSFQTLGFFLPFCLHSHWSLRDENHSFVLSEETGLLVPFCIKDPSFLAFFFLGFHDAQFSSVFYVAPFIDCLTSLFHPTTSCYQCLCFSNTVLALKYLFIACF